MRKLIWDINVTIDGFADHTAVIADDELHDFYTKLLDSVDIVLFGRKTYELMERYWPIAPEDPQATKSMKEFANKINNISKIVFSKTLTRAEWNNTRLLKEDMVDEVIKLKQQAGNSLSIGGISLASTLMKQDLIDEYWFLIQPIILGRGKHLVEGIHNHYNLKLLDLKVLKSGVVAIHYRKNEE